MTLTIARIRSRAVKAPMPRPVRTASGALDAAPLLLVDVECREGATGRAYGLGYNVEALGPMVQFLENVAPALEGKPAAPAEVAALFERKFRLLGRQGLICIALSVLDMALWDALGQTSGQTVAALMGAAPRPLPAYDSYGIVDPEKDRGQLEATVAAGFRAIKIKIGAATPERDAADVARIREIVGPEMALMVDFNQSQTAPDAIRRTRLIEAQGLAWVEEPVPAEDFRGHAAVRAAIHAPVMSGENWWYVSDMEKALAAGACDLAMPDVIKIGGLTGWQQVAGLAAARAVPISNHVHVEASAHCMPAAPTAGWFEYLDLASAILADPLAPVDGTVTARGPGLGIAWDEKAIARHLL
jgi:mandelate racemase